MRPPAVTGAPGLPLAPGLVGDHPLAVLGLPLWLVLVATVPRDRHALGTLALALAAAAATWGPRIHYHQDRAYDELAKATGIASVDTAYGDGWAAVTAWPLALAGGHPDAIHVAQALLTALAVPHLLGALRPALGARAALGAAVTLALLPLPLALAPTETRYVTIAALQAAALHGLARADRAGDALLVLAGGLIAHLRPFEIAVPLVLLGVALARRRGLAAAGLLTLLGARAVQLLARPPAPGGAFGTGLGRLGDTTWLGVDAAVVVLDPSRTPLGVVALAGLGVAVGVRRARGPTLALLGALLLASLVYVPQPYVVDRLRMQLPAQTWLAALAGLGLAGLPGRAALAAGALALATAWPARAPLPTTPWQVEYVTLRAALRAAPPGTTIAYDSRLDRGWVRMWAEGFAPVRLVPLAEAPPGSWRWIGLADHLDGPVPLPPGEVVVRATATTDPDGLWGCGTCPAREVPLGLVRPP